VEKDKAYRVTIQDDPSVSPLCDKIRELTLSRIFMNFSTGVLLEEFVENLYKNWLSTSYNVLTEKINFCSHCTNILIDICLFVSV
jgi:hypothetical protein